MRRKIITIAGSPGSGKSSTAKALAAALRYSHYSSGDLFRQLAAQRHESIEAINIAAEIRRDIDLDVDNLLKEMYRSQDKIVIDSRMAWHWMPESFKVYLLLDLDTAALRIFSHLQKDGRLSEDASSVQEARRSIQRRFESEQRRYKSLYGVDFTNPENFDIILNTKESSLDNIVAMLKASYKACS